ncbi:MAG: hypothetical protein PHN78_04860 [Dehalococcoidales bacterium]|nr:hypothetical protein [Dehalococcoidales bacterium]
MNINEMDSRNSALPLVAGILLIVDGGFKILFLLGSMAAGLFAYFPPSGFGMSYSNMAVIFIVCAVILTFVGTFTIIAGIHALQRRRWGLALAGSIVAVPFSIFGIAALIMLASSKKDFAW